MAFMVPGVSKNISFNAPKYKKIVEPFGEAGSMALYPGMKKAKEHIWNIFDEILFKVMIFIQNISIADKSRLKKRDWIGSKEAFEMAVKITATEGIDLFYRFFYLKHFSSRQTDPEADPVFDFLKFDKNVKNKIIIPLGQMKSGLKNVTITNDDPLSVISTGGSDTFTILLPKTPEHVEAVKSKLKSLSGNYFFGKKSKNNDELILTAKSNTETKTSVVTASTIMINNMEIITNYKNKLENVQEIIDNQGGINASN